MNRKGLLCSFIALTCSIQLLAQTGTEFWFVAPDATSGHNEQPIYLNLSAYDDSAYVTVSQPANPGFVPISVAIQPNNSSRINLTPWITDIETTIPDVVLNNGIYIQSTALISAYYEIAPYNNADIFALKSDNALGTDFLISAQTYWRSATKYNPDPFNCAIVVATKDNTEVNITPSNDIVGHPANVTYTVLLDRGQTYMLRAQGPQTADRFGGTEITSSEPIAVTISDDSIENNNYGGCKDIIGDQTIPVNMLGVEYVLVKGFLGSNPDRIYVMGTKDNTYVAVDGGGPNDFVVNHGQTQEVRLYNQAINLRSSEDIYVMHVSGFGCEVGMAIVPSVRCTGSEEVSFVRSQPNNFYIVVYTVSGAESAFEINGDPGMLTAADFSPVPGTGGVWVSARKQFNNTQIQIGTNYRVTNNKRKFHFGIINGGSTTGCLYGYFTDFGGIKTDPIYRY